MLKVQVPVFAVVAAFALAPAAEAIPIPLPGAFVSASTQTGTSSQTDTSAASTIRTSTSPDFSESQASATVGGAVRARSSVDAASGQLTASSASSSAIWIGNFTTGGADPGAAIDINFDLSVDGILSYFNNNSGAGLDDIITAMELTVSAHDITGTQTLFDGAASIQSVARRTPPAFAFSGFTAGDFTGSCVSSFTCTQSLDASISLSPLLVGFGSVFAIELSLMTEAFAFAGQEITAHSNFFDTVSIDLSTTTQGVFIETVGGAPTVPSPGTLALLGLGLMSLTASRRK